MVVYTTLYLVPVRFCGTNSKVPMEYRIVERKRDMRTKFCKENEKHIIAPDMLDDAIARMNGDVYCEGSRLIAMNGRAAVEFRKLVSYYQWNGLS